MISPVRFPSVPSVPITHTPPISTYLVTKPRLSNSLDNPIISRKPVSPHTFIPKVVSPSRKNLPKTSQINPTGINSQINASQSVLSGNNFPPQINPTGVNFQINASQSVLSGNNFPHLQVEPVNIPFITSRTLGTPNVQYRPSSPILIQSRPKTSTIGQSSTYNPNQINFISTSLPDTSSSQATSSINSFVQQSSNLYEEGLIPRDSSENVIIYQKDPATGKLTRSLLTAVDDQDVDPDQTYTINQEWLLFNRQGDQYDRIMEWKQDPELVDEENENLPGVSTLNEGITWGPLPAIIPVPNTGLEGYKRLLEYSQTQIAEQSDT